MVAVSTVSRPHYVLIASLLELLADFSLPGMADVHFFTGVRDVLHALILQVVVVNLVLVVVRSLLDWRLCDVGLFPFRVGRQVLHALLSITQVKELQVVKERVQEVHREGSSLVVLLHPEFRLDVELLFHDLLELLQVITVQNSKFNDILLSSFNEL